MSFLFQEILYRPLFNLLIGLYNVVPGSDLGVAIILLTLLIRFIFVPLTIKASRAQRKLTQIQPKIQELQKKHKNDKAKFAEESMRLYKEHGANPFSSCLPILIQLPFIFALYRVFISGLDSANLELLYTFVQNPGQLNEIAFRILPLNMPSRILALFTGGVQMLQLRNARKFQSAMTPSVSDNPALKMSQQMLYFFPIMIVVIGWNLPSGLVLYWAVSTIFQIFEQLYINRRYHGEQTTDSKNNKDNSGESGV